MKKRILILTCTSLAWAVILSTILVNVRKDDVQEVLREEVRYEYTVYSGDEINRSFEALNEAIAFAKRIEFASVRSESDGQLIWTNVQDFVVTQNEKWISDFPAFSEAVRYAKQFAASKVYFRQGSVPVWEHTSLPSKTDLIDAPLVAQMPELPRGCEVTSLAMLLQFAGIETDKMELAEQVKRDPTPYQKKKGIVHFGNPYEGFVGDMYSFSNPGYGVYHEPIKELAEQYLPNQIMDMTGSEFPDILFTLERGIPVWVIANTHFSRLPESLFETWETPTGEVRITYKEHSVLITGYDEQFIYFNDPLANIKNRKISVKAFQEGWEQMGKQAITYVESPAA